MRIALGIGTAGFGGCNAGTAPSTATGPRAEIRQLPGSPDPALPEIVREVYRIDNRGDRNLTLGPPRTTCGCAGVRVEPTIVVPISTWTPRPTTGSPS